MVVLTFLLSCLFFACTPTIKQIGTGISDSIESSLSMSLASSVIEQTPVVEDSLAHDYINNLCRAIGAKSDRSDLPYQAWIVDSDEINAFTVGGGYLFFNKGLIARSRNESELAGVVSHEIGHCVGRHLTKKLVTHLGVSIVTSIALGNNPSQSREIAAALLGAGGGLFALHLSRENESEADSIGVEQMLATGINPSGLPSFFGVLRDFYGDRGGIEQYFAEHPPLSDRISSTERIISERSSAAQRTGLREDAPSFRTIRERMRWLTRYAGVDTFVVDAGKLNAYSTKVDFKQADNVSVWLDLKILQGSPRNIRVVITDPAGLEALKQGSEPRSSAYNKTVTSGLIKIPIQNQKEYAIVFDNSISRSSSKQIIANVSFHYEAK